MRYQAIVVAIVILLILVVGYTRVLSPHSHGPVLPPKVQIASANTDSSNQPEIPAPAGFPATVTDAAGAGIRIDSVPRRIVSLAPGATELLFDLGAGNRIVGDTTACDWPPQATSIPHIGGAFDMSLESIMARKPDLIVGDGTINQKTIITLQSAGMHVLVIAPKNLGSSYDAIRILGRATGQTTEAAGIINGMRAKFNVIKQTVSHALTVRSVLTMYDTAPIYTSGPATLIDDLIRIAGGRNVAISNDPMVSEAVIQAQPDVIICAAELEPRIERMPAWKGTVPAVMHTAYFHPTNNATLVRPGLRLADGALQLAQFLHPELYTKDGRPAPQVTQQPAAGVR